MWPFTRKKKTTIAATDETSVFSRTQRLIRMNVHSALDEAEDPEKLADDMVRQYTSALTETKQHIQKVIIAQRMEESAQVKDRQEVDENHARAELAVTRAKTRKAAGNAKGAAQDEGLARKALQAKHATQTRVESREHRLESQRQTIENLKEGFSLMEQKLQEIISRRDELKGRLHMAATQESVMDAAEMIDASDPTSAMSQLERKVSEREAAAGARTELAAMSLQNQFDALERSAAYTDADLELEAMMSGEIAADTDQS